MLGTSSRRLRAALTHAVVRAATGPPPLPGFPPPTLESRVCRRHICTGSDGGGAHSGTCHGWGRPSLPVPQAAGGLVCAAAAAAGCIVISGVRSIARLEPDPPSAPGSDGEKGGGPSSFSSCASEASDDPRRPRDRGNEGATVHDVRGSKAGHAPTAGSNSRAVTELDAPIAAAYPTAANKSTAQWRVYTDIGRDLSSRGRHEEAGVYLRRALAEAKAGFGDGDPHVAAARNNLAELYRLQRRWDEAEALYADAAAALERHYGPSHPAAATAMHNLAGCQLSRGNHRGAYKTYAAAAEKKAAALGRAHPDYATTLFHMAEAKRAGGDGPSAAVLLEASVRILDAAGQAGTSVGCRRLERLAQVQGDLLGDHAAAEATRRRVLEAREHAAGRYARVSTSGGGGSIAAAASSAAAAAVAAACEAHAGSLAALGRWDEAAAALRRSVQFHELRAGGDHRRMWLEEDASSFAHSTGRAFTLAFDAAKMAAGRVLNGDLAGALALGGAKATASGALLQLQLAAARVKYVELTLKAAAALPQGGALSETNTHASAQWEDAREHLAQALHALQPMAEAAAASLAKMASSDASASSDEEGERGDSGPVHAAAGSGGSGYAVTASGEIFSTEDRSVAAQIRRRDEAAAPERHVAALVLFARAAVATSSVESLEEERRRRASGGGGDDAPRGGAESAAEGTAREHVGDAVEWLTAAARAAADTKEGGSRAVDPTLRRALARQLRECRLHLRQSGASVAAEAPDGKLKTERKRFFL